MQADLIITNALIVDGSGGAPVRGNLAIQDQRILAVGEFQPPAGANTRDAGGKVLAPGFIDSHTHDDGYLLAHPDMTPKVSQGITTVVTGNCGISLAPLVRDAVPQPLDLLGPPGLFRFATFADWVAHLQAQPAATNVIALVGHTTLRVAVMDDTARARRPRARGDGRAAGRGHAGGRLRRIHRHVLSAGGGRAHRRDHRRVRAAGRPRRLYATHLRDEADHIVPAMEEALEIGRATGARVVFSHHKLAGERNHGRSRETLELTPGRPRGSRLPGLPSVSGHFHHAAAGPREPSLAHHDHLVQGLSRGGRARFPRTHADIGPGRAGPARKAAAAAAIYFVMDEGDVERIASFPLTLFGSDGLPFDPRPHPRQWGTFPRILARMVRESGLMTLEQAVHKMTGLAARQYGLAQRGRIAPGCHADLVLFDADRVQDRATFEDPIQVSAGIDGVWVNGRRVWNEGRALPAYSGQVLRRAPDAA
ncbi:N-acyl-D-amino-acid deacylase family protein [Achromobacter sp. DMS1]|uniref:N-acyl-D-amino-acid deacylase family protein n=1 Tax=Achromobacter sp. DMS1 TaxID=1688405 RepID=UPI000AB505F8|nr:amidohydrolase family protein [Achromobacter sp. DMS1]